MGRTGMIVMATLIALVIAAGIAIAIFATPDGEGTTHCVRIGSNPCVPVVQHT
jgi:hypothetical protein